MENQTPAKLSKPYFYVVTALTIVLPAVSIFIEWKIANQSLSIALIGKWFIFYAVGMRLLIAGIRQVIDPAFTAKEIFHIEDEASHDIIKELGFANLCFGLIGISSLFLPGWRVVSACGSGLYYALAGINHFIKKPVSPNETFALVTDIFIFLVLLGYVLLMF